MKQQSVVAFIPVRSGSKGLPRKNYLKLAGIPLIQRAVADACAATEIDEVVVTTDCEELALLAREAGASFVVMRDAVLANDSATTEETLSHALKEYESVTGMEIEICVFLTATDAFRRVSWLDDVVVNLRTDPELDSSFVATKVYKNFWVLDPHKEFERVYPWMRKHMNRQEKNETQIMYREDSGLALASRAKFWRQGVRIGDRVKPVIIDDGISGIDIHSSFDLEIASLASGVWAQK